MRTRVISGIVIAALSFATCIPGKDVLLVTLLICSIIGAFELFRVFKIEKSLPGFVGYAAILAYYINIRFTFIDDTWLFVLLFLLLLLLSYIFCYEKYNINQIMSVFFGVFYVGVMASYIYKVRMLDKGMFIVVIVFVCSWICDTFAYFAGVKLGKHKMCPKLSPKKSWEGAVGGVIGSMLVAFIYLFFARSYMDIDIPDIILITVIDGIACVFAMFGDLAASAIKRNYDIKDYGKLIPGHGGILDRFDSIIFTAPIIYYLCYYFV